MDLPELKKSSVRCYNTIICFHLKQYICPKVVWTYILKKGHRKLIQGIILNYIPRNLRDFLLLIV
jgi:hypothetical protein